MRLQMVFESDRGLIGGYIIADGVCEGCVFYKSYNGDCTKEAQDYYVPSCTHDDHDLIYKELLSR